MGSNRINYEKEFIGKIHSYYKFIEIMKRLTDEEKFAFLYEYFYKNVSYNYLELLYSELCFNASSHGDPTYEEYHGELNPNNNYMLLCSFSKFGIFKDDEIYKYESEKPNIMQSIVELRNRYDLSKVEDIEKYKKETIDLVKVLYFDHIQNAELREKFLKVFIRDIINPSLVPVKYDNYKVLYDITWMVYQSCWHYSQSVYDKGLIRKGVCRHYAAFINKVLDEFGFNTVYVIGKSIDLHAWNMIELNGEIRFIDISAELFLRDAIVVADFNFNKGDWYLVDIDKMFELEPYREIRQLDDIKLDTYITKDNYKENIDVLFNALNHKEQIKKKSLIF